MFAMAHKRKGYVRSVPGLYVAGLSPRFETLLL
jgi:hypothetical protein